MGRFEKACYCVISLTTASYLALVLVFMTIGCATDQLKPITKYNSPIMRIMIDPSGLNSDQLTRLQISLVQSGKWIVVDRGHGFDSIVNEQNMIHKKSPNRFDDREKYAHWGKLYSVGAVVVARANCERKSHFMGGIYNECLHSMTLVHANTGEVLAAAEMIESSGDGWNAMPSWEYTVDKLNGSVPSSIEHKEEQELVAYKDLSAQEAKRHNRQPAQTEEDDE